MREMKDSGIISMGFIPVDWAAQRVKYVSKVLYGYPLDSNLFSSDGFPMIRIRDITSGEIETYYNGTFPSKYIVKKGDILLGMDGDFNLRVWKNVDAVLNQRCCSILGSDCAEKQFLYYALQWPLKVKNDLTYSTTVKHLLADGINNLQIALPNILEQRRIADFLDAKCAEIDALTADIEKQIETLEQYKRSVITEAVTKGLDKNVEMKESGTEWLGKIPSSWEISRIASVYSLRNTKVSEYDYQPLSVTMKGIVPQLETAAKTNAHDDRKLVKAGDFAINSRSDRRGSCGISPVDGSVSLINTILKPLNKMNPRYYNWLFHTEAFADEFYKWGHGIVDDLWTTGWQEMKRILIPSPSLEEQEQIACFLDNKCGEIDGVLLSKQKQLDTLAEYKKSLIYEYVTGKKEVPVV